MSKVIFTSNRPLERAENIKAVWDAYEGDKEFSLLRDVDISKYDLMVTDEIPKKSPGKVIMIGHGISGGKTYGLDQPRPYVTSKHTHLIDYAVCTSTWAIYITAKMFDIDKSKVLPLGMPRTDQYIGAKKGDGGTILSEYRRSYLYAPTFASDKSKIDWNYIHDNLEDGEILLAKPHMLTPRLLPRGHNFKRIIEHPSNIPTAPYLKDADVIITDYSSILFDAHILCKTVILFEKDRDQFLKSRGMYRKYPEGYSSRHCDNEKDLIELMHGDDLRRYEDVKCQVQCAGACDGHSTKRVIGLIENVLKED